MITFSLEPERTGSIFLEMILWSTAKDQYWQIDNTILKFSKADLNNLDSYCHRPVNEMIAKLAHTYARIFISQVN